MVVKNGDLPIFTMVEIVKQSPTKTNPNDSVIQNLLIFPSDFSGEAMKRIHLVTKIWQMGHFSSSTSFFSGKKQFQIQTDARVCGWIIYQLL